MKYYTGIGSRETPENIMTLMKQMAKHLSECNYTLRSGGANGADKAFEGGCDSIKGTKEIYLPWPKFNGSNSILVIKEDGKGAKLAEKYHPYWHNLSQGAKKLQARNSYQVLGKDLNTLSDFVICYTKKGMRKGGTGQALRISEAYNIPIFDCGLYEHDLDLLKQQYRIFIKEMNIL